MLATPAKWNVFRVICVPGSPMLWAPTAPTAVPSNTTDKNRDTSHTLMLTVHTATTMGHTRGKSV